MLVTDSVFGCVDIQTEIIGDVCGKSVVDVVTHVLLSSDVPSCQEAEKEETNICECMEQEARFDWASANCKISPDMPTIAQVYSLCMASTFEPAISDIATSEMSSNDFASSSRPLTSDILSSGIAATSEAETTENIASSDFASSFMPMTSDDIFSSEISSTPPQCGNGICEVGEELSCLIDCMSEILDGMCECVVSAGMCDATCDAIFQIESPQCRTYGASGICGQLVDSTTPYHKICPDCSMETTQSDTLSTEAQADIDVLVDFSMDDYTVDDIHSTADLDAGSTYVDGDTTFTNKEDATYFDSEDATYFDGEDATYFDDETSMDDFLGNDCPKDSHRADDGLCYCDSNHMLVTDPVFGCDPRTTEDSTIADESTTEAPGVTTAEKPEVSVDLEFIGLTQANFASKKFSIKLTLSRATGVPQKDIFVTLVTSRRNRRMLQDSSTVRAVFKTQEPTTVKDSITKENLQTLTEQSDDLQDIQLLAVSEPTISVPSTTESTEADTTSTESSQTSPNAAESSTTQRTATLPAQQGELANSQNLSGQTWPIFELAILGACFLTLVALLFTVRSRCAKTSDEFKVMETLWKDEDLSRNADHFWEGLQTPSDREFAQAEGSTETTQPTKRFIQEV